MKESMYKRSRLELYYLILKSCISNENHTRGSLNRQLKVPYALLNECLIYLERLGFLDVDYNQRTIKTTLEGQEYVRKFSYLMQQVGYITHLKTWNFQVNISQASLKDLPLFDNWSISLSDHSNFFELEYREWEITSSIWSKGHQ